MMRQKRICAALIVGALASSVLLVPAVASAQNTKPAAAAAAAGAGGGKEEGYGYEFSDDPLSAGGFGPNDATIRVRPGPVRTTLIRPRTSFVPEMLKSVENL
jgi:opacity protein-like surface antigen